MRAFAIAALAVAFSLGISAQAPAPLRNDTMHLTVNTSISGTEVCGRIDPNAGARVNATMKMAAHLDHMHLIDNASGRVL